VLLVTVCPSPHRGNAGWFALLLDWRGRRDGNDALVAAAAGIESAVERVLDEPGSRTRDLGGHLGTAEFAGHVVARLRGGSRN
jgi:3-isopropylmalate dehydrogenase